MINDTLAVLREIMHGAPDLDTCGKVCGALDSLGLVGTPISSQGCMHLADSPHLPEPVRDRLLGAAF